MWRRVWWTSYRLVRLFLVVLGAYLVIGLAYIEVVREGRVGLGSGIVVAGLLASIKGIGTAITSTPPSRRRPADPE